LLVSRHHAVDNQELLDRAMPSVIDRQIDSLKASVADVSASEPSAGVATVRREYEDLLAMAVALYERIRTGVQQWQASVKDWESPAWLDQARQFEARYRRLQETFANIAAALADLEAAGGRPEGALEFRAAKLDLDLLCQLSVDRMLKADESLRQGRGRSMAEVRDELRRRLGA
jgi:exonuclease VII large subunit